MLKLDAYKLKWIAIIGMVTNHMVITWWEIMPIWLAYPLYAAGGLTFPIMAYFVVEGYRHTSNLGKYMLRLLTFGLIAAPFHILALAVPLGGGNPMFYPWLNIMFSIVLGLIVLKLYDKIRIRALFWLLYVVVIVPVSFIFFEWYFIGTTMVLLYHIIRNENIRRIASPIFAGVCWIVFSLLAGMAPMPEVEGLADMLATNPAFQVVMPTFAIGCFVAALLVKNYTGERGKRMKWLFYAFYPIHLAVLAAVALALGLIDLSVFGL
ncbi:MAG: conjugal transfer protein TraX [Oscillospiraceae bacterium]|nr:conjugal transfer protein TraX [Oscillospiraceae bacterium]